MFAGMLICWLLNMAQLGIAFLLLSASEKMLPSFYVLVFAIGLVQIGYVVPIYHLLQRNGKARAARGLIIAAGITALINAVFACRILPLPR
jgi:formate-dependent nitrite reductase membrane component NrfD